MTKGSLAALGAYILWGLLPVYWKLLHHVPALETLGHRVVWSMVVVLGLLLATRHWRWLRTVRSRPILLLPFLASALLLGLNWFTYIWAVQQGHIVESSLGYFITPLVNVLLGLLILRERLRRGQGIAVIVAAIGVAYLTWNYGGLPWIALTLALTFGLYGFIRKTAPLGSLEGLALEMTYLVLPALAYLVMLQLQGAGALGRSDGLTYLLLMGTGVITVIPLLLFAFGAKRVTLISLGIMQYTAPTLQFLLGVFVYGERFTAARLVGFVLIWAALAIYTTDGVLATRRRRALAIGGSST